MKKTMAFIVVLLTVMVSVAHATEAENIALGRMAEFNQNVRNVVNSAKNTALGNSDFSICVKADKAGVDLSAVTSAQIVSALGLTNSIDPNSINARIVAQFGATKLIIKEKCKPVIDGLKQAVSK